METETWKPITLGELYRNANDQIREQLYGDSTTQGDWQTIEQQVLSQIQQAILTGHSVIYDATNYNRRQRIDLLQKLSNLSPAQWIGIYLKTPLEQCKEWNQKRDWQVTEAVIDIMDRCLNASPPTIEEGLAKIYEIPKDLAVFYRNLG